jgi:hypothetical protein
MQITPLFIYLLTRLDSLEFFIFMPTAVIGIILVIMAVLTIVDEYSRETIKVLRNSSKYKWAVRFAIFGVLYLILVPDKKEVIAMYAIPKIVNSDVAQKDIPELIDLTIKDLEKRLKSKEL